MIAVCNRSDYEYDINALLKSFFPQQEVQFFTKRPEIMDEACDLTVELQVNETSAVIRIEQAGVSCLERSVEFSEDNSKSKCKLHFYDVLCEYTKSSLPWGNLTGIRPTKLAMSLFEEGEDDSEICAKLWESHRVSREKAELSIAIAKREHTILTLPNIQEGYSLYIGIPFCPTTCLYCSFTSYPIHKWESQVWDYLYAMEKEMDFWAEQYRNRILSTVYIGGGTPTTLSAQQLQWLIDKIKSKFNFDNVLEFTVEAGRADSITPEKLRVLYESGVTRISVNPQTMNEKTLQLIGRKHTVSDVYRAYQEARDAGFDNINMDLILGLPGEEEAEVVATTEAIKGLSPDSITIHSLAIKRASALNRMITEQGMIRLCNTDRTMKIAAQAAEDLSMVPYYLYRQKNMAGNFENVGYAREGKYGIYNILIMEERQTIVAIGAGSITKVVFENGRMERSDNVKDVGLYIAQTDEMIERKRRILSMTKKEAET